MFKAYFLIWQMSLIGMNILIDWVCLELKSELLMVWGYSGLVVLLQKHEWEWGKNNSAAEIIIEQNSHGARCSYHPSVMMDGGFS